MSYSFLEFLLIGVGVMAGVYVLVRLASYAYFRSKGEFMNNLMGVKGSPNEKE